MENDEIINRKNAAFRRRMNTERFARRYREAMAMGLCVRCRKNPVEEGYSCCGECRAKRRMKYATEKNQERKNP